MPAEITAETTFEDIDVKMRVGFLVEVEKENKGTVCKISSSISFIFFLSFFILFFFFSMNFNFFSLFLSL